MKNYLFQLFFIAFISIFVSCLKGRIPPTVTVPISRIDSTFLNYFRLTSGITAGEGTTSLTLTDGRTLWLFGNSHLNDYLSGVDKISCNTEVNSAAMVSDANFNMTLLNSGSNDFIPSNETGKWFTPLHAYEYADTVFVFAKKQGGLQNTRTFVAKFHYPDLTYIRVDSFLFNSTNYGYTVFLDQAKGFCYTYGLFNPTLNGENNMYLARFPMNSLHDKWQYYSSVNDEWVDPSSSASPIGLVPGENFSIRKIKNKYVFLTQASGKACNKGIEIYSQTSAYLYGPFLNYQLLHTVEDNIGGNTPVTFGITLHPQFLNPDNEVLITYAMSGYSPCVPTCVGGYDNPDYYRIRTLRVGLKKIDAAF